MYIATLVEEVIRDVCLHYYQEPHSLNAFSLKYNLKHEYFNWLIHAQMGQNIV